MMNGGAGSKGQMDHTAPRFNVSMTSRVGSICFSFKYMQGRGMDLVKGLNDIGAVLSPCLIGFQNINGGGLCLSIIGYWISIAASLDRTLGLKRCGWLVLSTFMWKVALKFGISCLQDEEGEVRGKSLAMLWEAKSLQVIHWPKRKDTNCGNDLSELNGQQWSDITGHGCG